MASNKDPFPSSLPRFAPLGSPTMSPQGNVPEGGTPDKYFADAFPPSSPDLSSSNAFFPDLSSQSHTSTASNSSHSRMSTALHGPNFSQSPESSRPHSSSGSSAQHHRNGSSNSSHSGEFGRDFTMADDALAAVSDAQVAAWSAAENVAGIRSSNDIGATNSIQSMTSTALPGLTLSEDPMSRLYSSSSSKFQHQRNGSNHSSHSGLGRDVAMMDEDQVAERSATENVVGTHSSNDIGTTNVLTTPEGYVDLDKWWKDQSFKDQIVKDQIFEDQIFDYEMASRNGGPCLDSKAGPKTPMKDVKMPYRTSPTALFPVSRKLMLSSYCSLR